MRNGIALALAILLCLSGYAFARVITTSNVFDWMSTVEDKDAHLTGRPGETLMAGGDSIDNAVVIPALPFQDTGNTCGFIDDYDEACVFSGSTSPDVVYSLAPAQDMVITIDLCASIYDTKVYVYRNVYTPGSPYACNDDYCGFTGYQSAIRGLPVYFGDVYYIVIDGYGGDCGEYTLDIAEYVPCVQCPPGALQDGEPDCYDGYTDTYNGGCNSTPPVFSVVSPSCQIITICGTSGTYYTDGDLRDTDWFEIDLLEESDITFCCIAEFPLQILVIDGNHGCPVTDADILDWREVGGCEEACIQITLPLGRYWLWVGPTVTGPTVLGSSSYAGVPCGSDYVMTIEGYGPGYPSAAEQGTWGSIKTMFRR